MDEFKAERKEHERTVRLAEQVLRKTSRDTEGFADLSEHLTNMQIKHARDRADGRV